MNKLKSNFFALIFVTIACFLAVYMSFFITEGISNILSIDNKIQITELIPETAVIDQETAGLMVILQFFCVLFIFGFIFLIFKYFDKQNNFFEFLGFQPHSIAMASFIVGALLYTLGFWVAFVTSKIRIAKGDFPQGFENFYENYSVEVIILLVIYVIINALWRELLFRAYLQTRFIATLGVLPGLFFSAAIFVMVHIIFRNLTTWEIVNYFTFFSLVGYFYHISKSIFAATAFHAAANFWVLVYGANNELLPPQFDRFFVFSSALIIAIAIFERKKNSKFIEFKKENSEEISY